MKNLDQNQFAESVAANQNKLSSGLKSRFDYIVCGAGSSGLVAAVRRGSFGVQVAARRKRLREAELEACAQTQSAVTKCFAGH